MALELANFRRHWKVTFALAALGLGVLAILAPGPVPAVKQAGSITKGPAGMELIKHIVFIIKENRSFDHYFGRFPGAAGATNGMTSTGQRVPLSPAPDVTMNDVAHSWFAAKTGINGGKMNGWDLNDGGNVNGNLLAYTQMTQAQIPNYWKYAQYYALGDHMFSSIHADSFPNHLYTIAATSGGVHSIPVSPKTKNGQLGAGVGWGCDDDPDVTVKTINEEGEVSQEFPCFEFQTLADELNNAGVSWKYYAPSKGEPGYVFSTYNAIGHIRNGPDWTQNVVPDTQFAIDAANGNLPAVSWVVSGKTNEHPPNSTCYGENWTVNNMNALLNGPDGPSSAVFIVWDDFGGFYDHIVPPALDLYGLGPRVPFLILSPYVKPGHISHTRYEFSSVLKFIEELFGLPALSLRDANANDITDAFNFKQTPLAPLILQQRDCPIVSTANLSMGHQAVGTKSAATALMVSNFGSSPLAIHSITSTKEFPQTNACPPSLASGESCKVNVTFAPSGTGTRTGTLTVVDSDGSSPQVTQLTGEGSYLIVQPTSLNFGTIQPIGTSTSQTFTITNSGATAVTITSVTAINDFSAKNNCATPLAQNASCTVTITFTPTEQGPRYGWVTVHSTDPGGAIQLRLVGKLGTALSYSAKSLTFVAQTVNTTSAAQSITITNVGPAALNFGPIQATGPFRATTDCGVGVQPGSTCAIEVTYTPTAKGKQTGSLTLIDSDPASPQSLSLTGTGK